MTHPGGTEVVYSKKLRVSDVNLALRAECIVERPENSTTHKLWPLANFGSVSVQYCVATAYDAEDVPLTPPKMRHAQVQTLIIESATTHDLLVSISPPNSDGGFVATWHHRN